MSYSAFICGMVVDVMPLFIHGLYVLIRFLWLIGENAVLMDKMSFLHLNIEFCANLLISRDLFVPHCDSFPMNREKKTLIP